MPRFNLLGRYIELHLDGYGDHKIAEILISEGFDKDEVAAFMRPVNKLSSKQGRD